MAGVVESGWVMQEFIKSGNFLLAPERAWKRRQSPDLWTDCQRAGRNVSLPVCIVAENGRPLNKHHWNKCSTASFLNWCDGAMAKSRLENG